MYDLLLAPGVKKGSKGVLENIPGKSPGKTFVIELIFSIFENLQIGKYAEYCISSNKRRPLASTNSFKI